LVMRIRSRYRTGERLLPGTAALLASSCADNSSVRPVDPAAIRAAVFVRVRARFVRRSNATSRSVRTWGPVATRPHVPLLLPKCRYVKTDRLFVGDAFIERTARVATSKAVHERQTRPAAAAGTTSTAKCPAAVRKTNKAYARRVRNHVPANTIRCVVANTGPTTTVVTKYAALSAAPGGRLATQPAGLLQHRAGFRAALGYVPLQGHARDRLGIRRPGPCQGPDTRDKERATGRPERLAKTRHGL
jgi:hypothetical protein